ncbi:MAG: hypothetical protein A2Y33_07190 [Spirochaetes bacterium GWF1_51_8]|nr:MAG: hypothetical protein A2Y33_07190 [Spirochaetes bacterium GWF1_51_8]
MSIKKNFVYNTALTIFNTLFPLLTYPYITRILGPENLGKFTFAQSFAANFGMFAIIVSPLYAIRLISSNRDNPDELNRGFSGILLINMISSLVMTIVFLTSFLYMEKAQTEPALYIIIAVSILLNAFSIDWLFQGLENYKFIAIRNFIFKAVFILLIFVFIRQPEHYIIYALFWLIVTYGANIINMIASRKKAKLTFSNLKPLSHLKEIGFFFAINLLSIGILNLDKTLMGFILPKEEAYVTIGLYGVADKVIQIALSVTNSLALVILPRVSYYFSNNKMDEFYEKMDLSTKAYLMLSLPLFAGIILTAPEIVMLISGEKFLGSIPLLQVLSGAILLVGFAYISCLQILTGMKRENLYLITLGISLAVQAVALFFLIPVYKGVGAAFGMLIGYGTQVIVSFIFGFKEFRLFFFKVSNLKYFLAAGLMSAAVYFARYIPLDILILKFILLAGIGVIVYFSVLLLTREVLLTGILDKLRKRLFPGRTGGGA